MATRMLNMDQLAQSMVRSVRIGGKEYEIKEMSVDGFIEIQSEAERLEKKSTTTEQLEATLRLVNRAIPTLPSEVVRGLPLEQLRVLVQFIQDDAAPTKEEAQEGK
jgi:hypothetical protein